MRSHVSAVVLLLLAGVCWAGEAAWLQGPGPGTGFASSVRGMVDLYVVANDKVYFANQSLSISSDTAHGCGKIQRHGNNVCFGEVGAGPPSRCVRGAHVEYGQQGCDHFLKLVLLSCSVQSYEVRNCDPDQPDLRYYSADTYVYAIRAATAAMLRESNATCIRTGGVKMGGESTTRTTCEIERGAPGIVIVATVLGDDSGFPYEFSLATPADSQPYSNKTFSFSKDSFQQEALPGTCDFPTCEDDADEIVTPLDDVVTSATLQLLNDMDSALSSVWAAKTSIPSFFFDALPPWTSDL